MTGVQVALLSLAIDSAGCSPAPASRAFCRARLAQPGRGQGQHDNEGARCSHRAPSSNQVSEAPLQGGRKPAIRCNEVHGRHRGGCGA